MNKNKFLISLVFVGLICGYGLFSSEEPVGLRKRPLEGADSRAVRPRLEVGDGEGRIYSAESLIPEDASVALALDAARALSFSVKCRESSRTVRLNDDLSVILSWKASIVQDEMFKGERRVQVSCAAILKEGKDTLLEYNPLGQTPEVVGQNDSKGDYAYILGRMKERYADMLNKFLCLS